MYYPILPHRPYLIHLICQFIAMRCIMLYRRLFMKKKQTIETQLDCRATASLQQQIESDLNQTDKSLASLLSTKDKDTEEDNDETKSSD